MRSRGPSRWEQAALVLLALAAIVAFDRSRKQSIALLAWLPCAVSLVWRLRVVPAWVRAVGDRTLKGLLGGLGLFAFTWSLYPLLPGWLVAWAPEVAGYGLTLLVCLFVLGTPVWSPAQGVIPAALGLLVVAALDPLARLSPMLAAAAGALFAYLVLTRRTVVPRATSVRLGPVVGLTLFGLLVCCVAGGIIRFLPWAQPHVEQRVASVLNTQATHYPAFSRTATLGTIEKLALSPRVVLRVWTPIPQRLRAQVFTRFDGRTWHAVGGGSADALRAPDVASLDARLGSWLEAIPGRSFLVAGGEIEEALGAGAIRSRMIQVPLDAGSRLVSPHGPLLVRAGTERLRVSSHGLLIPAPRTAEIYGVVNLPGSVGGEGEDPETLALPAELDPRFEELALRLAAGTRSAEERVWRTLEYLGAECRYSLDVGEFESSDPVAEFLFDKKRGYCQYFATAAAILLRLQRIPTRCVHGFAVLDHGFQAGHYVVRESDAHAWLDIRLPGQGWSEIDPTPPGQYRALHARTGGWPGEAWEWLKSLLVEVTVRLRSGDWRATARWLWLKVGELGRLVLVEKPVLGPSALLVVLGACGWRLLRGRPMLGRWWRRGKAGVGPGSRHLANLLASLDTAWAREGCARPGFRGPLEHLDGIEPNGISEALRAASRVGVDNLYRGHYGGEQISSAALEDAARRMEQAARCGRGAGWRRGHQKRSKGMGSAK